MTEQPPFCTTAQLAQMLNLSHRAVLHRISNGQIAATKLGDGRTSAYMIPASEVERLKIEAAA